MRSFRTKTNPGVPDGSAARETDASPAPEAGDPVRVVFVCWGNICRSPIAERVAEHAAASAGLDNVVFTSAAAENPTDGEPMDRRAAAALKARGYRYDRHGAHQITASEIAGADLVIAMEDIHIEMMQAIAPDATNLSLLTDYDPDAEPGSGVPDPWFGSAAGFFLTVDAIEAAMPGVLQRVRELQADR
jgi:protein-tyrosine phosphatase